MYNFLVKHGLHGACIKCEHNGKKIESLSVILVDDDHPEEMYTLGYIMGNLQIMSQSTMSHIQLEQAFECNKLRCIVDELMVNQPSLEELFEKGFEKL